jgi:hypothetical protein
MVWGLGSPTRRLSYFVRSFKLSFQVPKLPKRFQTLLLESQPEGSERFLHERQGILKSKYDPWKNNAGVFILILLSYPLGIAEK